MAGCVASTLLSMLQLALHSSFRQVAPGCVLSVSLLTPSLFMLLFASHVHLRMCVLLCPFLGCPLPAL
jgi:hypothetical protein